MSVTPWIEAYHFYEDEWESYDDLLDSFEWEIPHSFNMATYVCDRWADAEDERVALFADDRAGQREQYTFEELRNSADALANYLQAQGVERGQRVGIKLDNVLKPLSPISPVGNSVLFQFR